MPTRIGRDLIKGQWPGLSRLSTPLPCMGSKTSMPAASAGMTVQSLRETASVAGLSAGFEAADFVIYDAAAFGLERTNCRNLAG